jgi:hypothetical protein
MLKTRFLAKLQRIEWGFSRKKTGFCDFLEVVQDLSGLDFYLARYRSEMNFGANSKSPLKWTKSFDFMPVILR